MYRQNVMVKSQISRVETVEGETLEMKIERIVENKEPIQDGAPEIFTERKDGVLSAYNIRTDRWEIAADAMDMVQKNKQAKRDNVGAAKEKEKTEVKEQLKQDAIKMDGKPESAHGQEPPK